MGRLKKMFTKNPTSLLNLRVALSGKKLRLGLCCYLWVFLCRPCLLGLRLMVLATGSGVRVTFCWQYTGQRVIAIIPQGFLPGKPRIAQYLIFFESKPELVASIFLMPLSMGSEPCSSFLG
jgi:hypothetical protein